MAYQQISDVLRGTMIKQKRRSQRQFKALIMRMMGLKRPIRAILKDRRTAWRFPRCASSPCGLERPRPTATGPGPGAVFFGLSSVWTDFHI